MHTPTCRHTHTHKHLQVIVLEFMGHLLYRHTLYVWIRDVFKLKRRRTVLSAVRRETKRNPPEDFIHRERLPQRRGVCCAPILTFNPRETGQDRGGEEEKLPFSCSFPTQSPLLLPGVAPLSRQKSRRKRAAERT